ncbi:MAG TPA: prepilin-type N-terminal cleavage/methylation domain-containing protein [Chthoniobacteraceae bacterium]
MRKIRNGALPSARLRKKLGFTLVELLVVIAIIGVLAALAFPAYQRVLENSRATACVGNLRQVGAALNLYIGENGMKMPDLRSGRSSRSEEVPVIDNTLNRYLQDARVFACPSDPKFAATTGTSFFWNSALNGQALANLNFLNIATEQSKVPVLFDKEGFHPFLKDKLNILYADGHATNELKFWDGAQSGGK